MLGEDLKIEKLCEKLFDSYPKDNRDYKAAKGYLHAIKYCVVLMNPTYQDFCKWLAEHDFNILDGFRYRKFISHTDVIKAYPTFEEWKQDNADYIDGKKEEEQHKEYESDKASAWKIEKTKTYFVRNDGEEMIEAEDAKDLIRWFGE